MAPNAAHLIKIYAKASNASPVSGDEIAGLDDHTYNELADMIETTDYKDTSGWKTRIAGLQDSSLSLSGRRESADAPQNLLRSSKRSGATVWITIHFDPSASSGQKGVQIPMLVENFESGGGVADAVPFSASLQGNGAVVDV